MMNLITRPFLKWYLKNMHQEGFENPGPLTLIVFYQAFQFSENMCPAKCMT